MKKHGPPIWALKMLQAVCKERYLEQIEGDLMELFHREDSDRKARVKFGLNALRFLRWRYLKGLDDYEQLTTLAMIKNYFKVALRTLLKQKSYASINIVGLAIGLASCLLIVMYLVHERSYDKFYPDVDRIYRVANGEKGRYTPALLASTMMRDYPNVAFATKISGLDEANIELGSTNFIQGGGCWADDQIFNVFEMDFIQGAKENALSQPENIVLTQQLAKKFFQDENALGQTLKVDGDLFKVSAIIKDPPKNTHFPFKFIVADPIKPNDQHNWTGNNYWTYAKLLPDSEPQEMNDQLQELYAKYAGPEIISFSGHKTFEEFLEAYPDRYFGYTVQPMGDIHLYASHFSMGARGDYKNVVIFSLVALFILLIACVNYINMSTARSAIRSKEVGIRKAMGSYRKHIIAQFLTESILITFLAILFAILIAGASLEYFNSLTGRIFDYGDLFSVPNLLSITCLLIIVGLLAGAYPAYIISGFSPIKALRGQLQQAGRQGLRNGLVTFQFAISIFLVAATIVIFSQVRYMQSQELGVNIDQTLVITNGQELGDKYEVFKTLLEQRSDVVKVAKASNIPFHGFGDWTYQLPDEDNLRTDPMNAFVEPGIEQVLDLEIIKGRFFDADRVTDTATVIINQALANELGWKDPIGKRMTRGRGLDFSVIGVMQNFNYTSLKREIGPMIFRYGNASSEVGMWHQAYVLAKINSNDMLKTISEIEDLWNQQVSNYPFDAVFLNDSFQKHYEGERKFGSVFTTFSMLAIFIAFLGLFALTTFVLQKRYKEIAVRKVLGASVSSLLRMMIKDFTRLVLIGGFVGISVAFYWLTNWLEGYNYRIELTWYLLVIPVLLILFITWLVVSLKSYKAAIANPSIALKDE